MPKPTTLYEYYRQKVQNDKERLLQQIPDYNDLNTPEQELFDFTLRMKETQYLEQQIQRRLLAALLELQRTAPERFSAMFQSLKTEAGNKFATEEKFLQSLRAKNLMFVLNPQYFGCDGVKAILDAYESALGPARVKELMEAPLAILPVSPDYKGEISYEPYGAELDGLIERFTHGEDPGKNRENLELLTEVRRALQDLRPEVLKSVQTVYKGEVGNGALKGDDIEDRRLSALKKHGLTLLDGGSCSELVIHERRMDGSPEFQTRSDRFTRPLTEEEQTRLRNESRAAGNSLSQAVKDAVKQIGNSMDQLDYTTSSTVPLSAEQFPPIRPTRDDQVFFPAEQMTKKYAFAPVYDAKVELARAVQAGKLDRIRECMQAYREAERITDQMMNTLRSGELSDQPLYSSNMESTREDTERIPPKYALDFTNQNKLNSLSSAYFTLKNAGMRLEELTEDPIGACRKLADCFLAGSGLNSRAGSIGAALQFGLKNDEPFNPVQQFENSWYRIAMALNRGIAGIAGLEKDPARRAKFVAAVQLGVMLSTERIREEAARYETARKTAVGQRPAAAAARGAVYQTAALAPQSGEGSFELQKLMRELSTPRGLMDGETALSEEGEYHGQAIKEFDHAHKESWRTPDETVRRMAGGAGHAPLGELAQRNRQVLKDAAEEEQLSGGFRSRFDPELYLLHAFSAHSRLLEQMDPMLRLGEDYTAFRESVLNSWQLAKAPNTRALLKLGAMLAEDPDSLNFLQTDKSDQLKSSDSTEYGNMKNSIAALRNAINTLRSGTGDQIEKLYHRDFARELEKARADAFRYVQLKTRNGKKPIGSFHYASGNARAREAVRAWKQLGELQDSLGLRSPAQKLCDEARLELLQHRGNDAWMRERAMLAVGKMVFAQSMLRAGFPDAMQKRLLENQATVEEKARSMGRYLSRQAFFANKLSLADDAIRGKGEFRELCAEHGKALKRQYEQTNQKRWQQKAREDFCTGYALDVAAGELRIRRGTDGYDSRNRRIRNRAKEVLQRTEFREVMARMMKGKTAEELRQMHRPGMLDDVSAMFSPQEEAYRCALYGLRYEKRCAALAAESLLRANGSPRPSEQQIEHGAERLRQEPEFQSFIRQKLQGQSSTAICEMNEALANPQTQNQVRGEICGQFSMMPDLREEPEPVNERVYSELSF